MSCLFSGQVVFPHRWLDIVDSRTTAHNIRSNTRRRAPRTAAPTGSTKKALIKALRPKKARGDRLLSKAVTHLSTDQLVHAAALMANSEATRSRQGAG